MENGGSIMDVGDLKIERIIEGRDNQWNCHGKGRPEGVLGKQALLNVYVRLTGKGHYFINGDRENHDFKTTKGVA